MTKKLTVINKNRVQDIKKSAWLSLSENSKKSYQYDLNLFFKIINKEPKNINIQDILKFIEYLEKNNYKNATINRKIASLSKFFEMMVVSEEIYTNPVKELKRLKNINFKSQKEAKHLLTLQEIKNATMIKKTDTLQEKKIAVICKTLASTGLRISEMINITHDDIEHEEKEVYINIMGKGKKERTIYMDYELFLEIIDYYPKSAKSKNLFYTERNSAYNRINLYLQIKKFFLKRIGKKINPHQFRHFYATYKISVEKKDIKAVSKYLGHADIATTLQMYVDTSLDAKDAKIKI